MTHQSDRKVRVSRSQPTAGHVMIIYPKSQTRQSKAIDRFGQVSVQPVGVYSKYNEEFFLVDKEKEAQTGKWVFNVIKTREANQQTKIANKKKKKHSFQSKKFSKVEPVNSINRLPHEIILSPTTIDDEQSTHLSSFSSATSVDDIPTIDRSSVSTQTKSYNPSKDYSTDEFKNSEKTFCISKRVMIIFTIISIILIIGIITGVLVTIFVGRNGSTNSSGKNSKTILTSLSSINTSICPTPIFTIIDSLCQGEVFYNYYTCYQMATSTSFTIRFILQHDTISGHWYFDDISAVQNNNIQLIINGGFESNLTGWILHTLSYSTTEIHVDTIPDLAHNGIAYLVGASKNSSTYIEQTFNVIEGEYINVSFWWRYDEGLNLGHACEAIGQLIPSMQN